MKCDLCPDDAPDLQPGCYLAVAIPIVDLRCPGSIDVIDYLVCVRCCDELARSIRMMRPVYQGSPPAGVLSFRSGDCPRCGDNVAHWRRKGTGRHTMRCWHCDPPSQLPMPRARTPEECMKPESKTESEPILAQAGK